MSGIMSNYERYAVMVALGLYPRDGRMPRWSSKNRYFIQRVSRDAFKNMENKGWMTVERIDPFSVAYHVTRLGAEAAGVLGRCRREDVRR